MVQRVKGLLGGLVGASLMFGSTTASAAANGPTLADPWAVLSVMSGGAPAAALCGAAAVAAAAQNPTGCVLPALDAVPPPVATPPSPARVPPIAAPSAGFGLNPLLLGILAAAIGLGLYFAVRHGNSPT